MGPVDIRMAGAKLKYLTTGGEKMTTKISTITGLVLLVFFLALGCPFTPEGAFVDGEWYLELNIRNPLVSKAITVTEYDVTGLTIEVRDPDGAVIQTIEWQPDDGEVTHLIAVEQEGEHEIVVTHSGVKDDETIEVTESALFLMQAMVITKIDITPGLIGFITIDSEPVGVPIVDRVRRDFYSLQIRGIEFTPNGQDCEIYVYDRTFDGAAFGEITITNVSDGTTVFSRRYGNYGTFTNPGDFGETITLPYNKNLHIVIRGREFSRMTIFYADQTMATSGTFQGIFPVWQTDIVVTR
jgi:hypothetical protein